MQICLRDGPEIIKEIGDIMPVKHLSDILFDYLFGTVNVTHLDEEAGRAVKINGKIADLKTEGDSRETEME